MDLTYRLFHFLMFFIFQEYDICSFSFFLMNLLTSCVSNYLGEGIQQKWKFFMTFAIRPPPLMALFPPFFSFAIKSKVKSITFKSSCCFKIDIFRLLRLFLDPFHKHRSCSVVITVRGSTDHLYNILPMSSESNTAIL